MFFKAAGAGISKVSCQLIASDKSDSLRKVEKTFFGKVVSKLEHFCYFGGRIPCYNCRKLRLQMSTTIIVGTSQNNA